MFNCHLVNIYSAVGIWRNVRGRGVKLQFPLCTQPLNLLSEVLSIICHHCSAGIHINTCHVSIPPTHVSTPLYLCRSSWGLQSQPISLLVQLHALLFRRSCAVRDHAGRATRGAFVQQHQRPTGIHHLVNIWWINADLITFYSLMKNITFLEVTVNQLLVKIVLWLPLLVKPVITPSL